MIQKYFTITIAVTLILLFIAGAAPSVSAQEQTLRVSPVIINISLSPDKTYNHTVSIENLTRQPMPLRATLNNFESSGEEGGYNFETAKPNPLLSWITLSEDEFILEPLEKKEISVRFQTPKSIPVGGYYGMLFFEPVLQNNLSSKTTVNAKIGVLMLANLGVQDPKAKQAEIVTFQPDWISQDGTVPYLLRVQNVSLNFFTAKPVITFTPVLPLISEVKEITPEEKIIFPGKIRRWEETDKITDLKPNIYEVHLKLSTGNGKFIETTKYMVVIPYIQILLFTLGISLVLFLLLKRNKLRKAVRVLFRS